MATLNLKVISSGVNLRDLDIALLTLWNSYNAMF